MKHIGITGGSGFVGSRLSKKLIAKGYRVTVFTRSVNQKSKDGIRFATWDPGEGRCDLTGLQDMDAIVNLAGTGVANGLWTKKRKQQILDSRVESTNCIVNQLKKYTPNCKTFISASATGYYGEDKGGSSAFKEDDAPADDFLAHVCVEWEKAAHKADAFDRTVVLRFGVVLGEEAGAYKAFAMPQKIGVSPVLGSGSQMVSWIHVDDIVDMILFAIENPDIRSCYNAVAPEPVAHRSLVKAIAKAKGGIKIFIRIPALFLKIGMGELSQEVLKSCTVSSQKIQNAGFHFTYPTIERAVTALEDK